MAKHLRKAQAKLAGRIAYYEAAKKMPGKSAIGLNKPGSLKK